MLKKCICYIHTAEITEFFNYLDFTWNQIGECRVSKSAILTNWEALNFEFFEFLLCMNTEIYQINQIQSP